MPHKTHIFGIILVVLGIGGYLVTGAVSFTALIPALFGIVFIALARLAQKESMRKHIMHAAVLIALLGLMGTFTGLLDFVSRIGGNEEVNVYASGARALMALLCIGYISISVKSFIDARKDSD